MARADALTMVYAEDKINTETTTNEHKDLLGAQTPGMLTWLSPFFFFIFYITFYITYSIEKLRGNLKQWKSKDTEYLKHLSQENY